MTPKKYLVEFRDKKGNLLPLEKEQKILEAHPFLGSKPTFTIDDLCRWASFGEGRDNPVGPMDYLKVIKGIDSRISIREKTW